MSQFFLNSISGPIPPTVPTLFVTDSGTAVPSGNTLNVKGQSTPSTSGIEVTATGNEIDIRMFSPYTLGDFIFQQSTAGQRRAVIVSNTDNTSQNSDAFFQAIAGGTSAGCAWTQYSVSAGRNFSIGINNTTSDFRLVTSTGEGVNIPLSTGSGTTLWIISANGTQTLTGGQIVNYTAPAAGAFPYSALATDYFISVTTAAGARTVNLPNTPSTDQIYIIKDRTGNAGTNNITVTTPGGTVTIDGATTYVINTNYGSAEFIFNGTSYEVF